MCISVFQALELDQANTKALFRRAQAWQGLKENSKAMVTFTQAPRSLNLKNQKPFEQETAQHDSSTSRE